MIPGTGKTLGDLMMESQMWEEVAERAGYDRKHNRPPKDWTPQQQLDLEAEHAKEDVEMKCPDCEKGVAIYYGKPYTCEHCNGTGKLPALIKLSHVPEGGVFRLKNTKYIVIDRIPEDRSSGGTTFRGEKGGDQTYWWDHDNPKVKYLGPGKLVTKIEVKR